MRVLFALLVVACATNHGPPSPDGGSGACATTAVSFVHDVAPLVDHCGGELCHGGVGLSWPYASLVNQPATECASRMLVKPGDATNSYLVQKLGGIDMCSGTQMPKLGTPLSADQIATVATWICQGAANN